MEDRLVDMIVESEIRGVTPEMIDWWWDNMDKGYPLWHPTDHISFRWEVSPAQNGHVGAVQVVVEGASRAPAPYELHIRWADPNEIPNLPIMYKHVLLSADAPRPDGKPVTRWMIHQYEATSYGTKIRSHQHWDDGRPRASGEGWIKHSREEAMRFPHFLPELFRLWQEVKNPAVNVPCCLEYPYKDINKPRY